MINSSEILDHPITRSFIPNKITQEHEFNMLLERISSGVADHFGIIDKKDSKKSKVIQDIIFNRFLISDFYHYFNNLNNNFTSENILSRINNSRTFQHINNKWIITFEGIDATGKQTLSGLLNDYFNYIYNQYTIYNKVLISDKINIPNYDLPSGQEIAQILKDGNYNPETLQMKFALNRREVQNQINLDSGLYPDSKNNVQIFDRWVDSGAMYNLSKNVYNELKVISAENGGYLDQDFENALYNNKDVFLNQIKLEHTILELARPHLKILCTTPIDVVSKRISARAKDAGIHEDDLDSHEINIDFLNITQEIYTNIYSMNPKVFFKSEIFNHNYTNTKIIDTFKYNIEECIIQVICKLIDKFGMDLISKEKDN